MITKEMIDKNLLISIDKMSDSERLRHLSWSDDNEFSFYYCYYLLSKIEELQQENHDLHEKQFRLINELVNLQYEFKNKI